MKQHPETLPFPEAEPAPRPQKNSSFPSEKSSLRGSPKLQRIDRQQMVFRSVEIEKLISEDHEARAIWEFVGRLNLSCYHDGIRSQKGGAGRPALSPQLMISIWVYSYSKGVGSARKIAELCEFAPAYQWLTGMTSINHHTLSDFRIDHKEALDSLFETTLGLLSAEKLITMERVMHDGTKIKAFAKGDSFKRGERIEEHLKAAKEQMEKSDEVQEKDEINSRQEKARQRVALERKEKLEKALAELEKLRKRKKSAKEKEEARVSETDPEARIMKQSNGGFSPSYNVQISTDAANNMIVGVGVTQAGTDCDELIPAVERIEKRIGQTPDQMVVDKGYTSNANIVEMSKREIDLIGPLAKTVFNSTLEKRGGDSGFDFRAFTYDPANNNFTCPAGQSLRPAGKKIHPVVIEYSYRTGKGVCQKCQFQKRCCPQNSSIGRSITRRVDAPEIQAFKEKMQTDSAKGIYKLRSQTAEFPNAWIKEKIGLRQFRLQGWKKVEMESLWACITYNIQRWIGLKWRPQWALNGG